VCARLNLVCADLDADMPNAYNPMEVEKCWGEFWEKEGLMGADAEVSGSWAAASDTRHQSPTALHTPHRISSGARVPVASVGGLHTGCLGGWCRRC
jgi:hypothetical protein